MKELEINKIYKIANLYCGIGGNRKLWGEFLDSKGIKYENEHIVRKEGKKK